MTLEEFSAQFTPLPPQEKIRFLYTHIETLSKQDRVVFLLSILKEESSSPLVKSTALKLLREASFPESDVYQAFVTDEFRAIANAARRAVKEFEEKEKKNGYYVDAVLRKLRSLPDKERRLKILKAIARLKAPWILRVLLDALKDPCEANRDFLIKELSRREIWNLAPFLEKLHQPPWYVKSSVLKVLSLRKEPKALAAIEKVLSDPNVEVRRSAAEALGEIGGQEALAILVKLTKDESAYVRQAAAEAVRRTSRVRFSG
jgi:hypothetical protein